LAILPNIDLSKASVSSNWLLYVKRLCNSIRMCQNSFKSFDAKNIHIQFAFSDSC